jgi:DNA polymerase-3 subunit delta'
MLRRPEDHSFDTIIGHELVKQVLRRMIEATRVPHALLFFGADHLGKESMAYALVRYLLCEGKRGEAACRCNACTKISRNTHVDVRLLKPVGPTSQILIEQIRELQDYAYLTPTESDKKIVIFKEADRLTVSASNCLLKVLEEPPPHLVLILLTAHLHALLPTIRSRCAPLRFGPVEPDLLEPWLVEQLGCTPEIATVAALLSEGRPGMALDIATGTALQQRETMLQELAVFDEQGFAALFRVVNQMFAHDASLPELAGLLLSWFRDLLLSHYAPGEDHLLIHKDQAQRISQEATCCNPEALFRAVDRLCALRRLSTRKMIDKNLALEVALVDVGEALKKT